VIEAQRIVVVVARVIVDIVFEFGLRAFALLLVELFVAVVEAASMF
jgi:hypothetical protein